MKFVAPEVEIMRFSTEEILNTSVTTTSAYQGDCEAETPMD